MPGQHLLLTAALARVRAAAGAVARFQCSMAAPALAWLWEHRVSRRAILPGAAMLESAFAALRVLTGGSSHPENSPCTHTL